MSADLRDQDLRRRRAHTGDRHEVVHGGAIRGEGGPDRGVQLGDRRLQRLDHPQVRAQQDAWWAHADPRDDRRSPGRAPILAHLGRLSD
jgi:hypothetical protein